MAVGRPKSGVERTIIHELLHIFCDRHRLPQGEKVIHNAVQTLQLQKGWPWVPEDIKRLLEFTAQEKEGDFYASINTLPVDWGPGDRDRLLARLRGLGLAPSQKV